VRHRGDGPLFLNPGSAGPRRFSLPRTACVLELNDRRVRVERFGLPAVPPPPWGRPLAADL